jgi:hypothetical protein
MAYLIARSPSNLGAYRRASAMPVLPQLRVPIVGQPIRFRIGTRPVRTAPPRLRLGLGQDALAPGYAAGEAATGTTPIDVTGALPLDTSNFPGASASLMPFAPTSYPPLPAQISSSYSVQAMNLDPLNFVSPQAAIAAGADPQKTAAAWTKAVASFPSQGAAIAAGIPAGVITQLWAASRSMVPPPAGGSWFSGSTFGIKNAYLVAGLAGIALLAGGKKGRR